MNTELAELIKHCKAVDGTGYFPCDVLGKCEEEIAQLENGKKILRDLLESGDLDRKVLFFDNDNKTRLANDHADALLRSTEELAELQGVMEMYLDDNEVLRAALKAHGEEAAKGL